MSGAVNLSEDAPDRSRKVSDTYVLYQNLLRRILECLQSDILELVID